MYEVPINSLVLVSKETYVRGARDRPALKWGFCQDQPDRVYNRGSIMNSNKHPLCGEIGIGAWREVLTLIDETIPMKALRNAAGT